MKLEGGGPAGVVEGICLLDRRESGVDGGSEESGTANILLCQTVGEV